MTINICYWCDEPILPNEPTAPFTPSQHWECGLRSVFGGVNHINGLCSCCGGNLDPDPEGLSRREAAKAAALAWQIKMNNLQ